MAQGPWQRIDATGDTLLKQAPEAAAFYFHRGLDCIDTEFGKGYAAKHPELLVGFMHAASLDLASAAIARAVETAGEDVSGALRDLREIGEDLRTDHPLMGETLGGLDRIAEAIQLVAGSRD